MTALLEPSPASPLRGMLGAVSGRQLSPVFVGRDHDLVRLRGHLAAAADAHPGVVIVGGDAGVGKTRLVEELVRAAEAEAQVVVGGCLDLGDEGLAYAPFVTALRALVRRRGVAAVAELAGPGRAELTALLPELAADDAERTAGGDVDRRRLYETVAELLERAAELQPVVLVLEDLHWADRSSRDLLAFLARTLRDSRVLVIGTYRADDLHRTHPLRPFLAELDRVRGVERFELDRLGRDDVAALMADLLGRTASSAEVEQVFARSEGNPLFVEELACCYPDSGLPDSLRDLLMIRARRLSRPAQQSLHVAAVVGVRAAYPLLAAVSDLAEPDLLDALREAVEANVLVAEIDADAFSFRHSLLREAINDDLLPGEHTRLHARVAQALTDDPTLIDPDRWAAEVAHHWNGAHDQPRALATAFTAAEHARHQHAYAEELQLLERVLALWPVVPDAEERAGAPLTDVLALGVRAAARSGATSRTQALADQLVAVAEGTGDDRGLAGALLLRGKWCGLGGREQVDADLRRALALLPADEPSAARATALDTLAMSHLLQGDGERGEELAREALAIARAAGDVTAEVSALSTLGTVLASTEAVDEGLAYARESLALGSTLHEPALLGRVLTNLSHALCGLGRHEEAAEVARQGLAAAEEVGMLRTFGAGLAGNLADPLVMLGRLDEAQQVVDAALAQCPASPTSTAYLRQLAGRVAYWRGDLDAARAEVAFGDQAQARQQLMLQDWLPLTQLGALLLLEEHDPQGAFSRATGALTHPLPTDHTRYLWPLFVVAARAVADRAARARDLRDDVALAAALDDGDHLAGRAEELPVPGASGVAWRTAMLAELARAARADDVQTWLEVAAAVEKVDEPLVVAEARLRAAEVAGHLGERGLAAEQVGLAAEAADRSGAVLVRRHAEGLARRLRLDVTGGEAGGAAAGGADTAAGEGVGDDPVARLGLTERELEVLLLVAEGLSNRQIGERLFMSPKTASVHVSNILAKLQVGGRGEAAAVAHRLGLVT